MSTLWILGFRLFVQVLRDEPTISFSSITAIASTRNSLYVHRLALAIPQPLLESIGNKLWTIIAAQVIWCAAQQK